ncbi:DUF4249 family protein [Marivirga arenosa]|uniref:DUF4249 family protein n=1 Tax=Marivirga arenosa TaxID=3059076 RepID=A0AA51X3X1_9BACT|nr:DUF4249 family protein [Marivirga sp. BKB1-2]WNB17211.1 DUF4249 family protein [Marivirga sp. BKB1-2]
MRIILISILILYLCSGCIDEFDPDYNNIKNENRLVVDANLKVNDSIHEIFLSRTFAVGDTIKPTSGIIAEQVYIKDSNNKEYFFIHQGGGRYTITSEELCLEQNTSYQLFILIQDGSLYSSETIDVPKRVDFQYYDYEVEEVLRVVDERAVFLKSINFIGINEMQRTSSVYFQTGYVSTFELYPPLQGLTDCWSLQDEFDEIPSDLSVFTFCYAKDSAERPLNVQELKPENDNLTLISLLLDFKFLRGHSIELDINAISKQTYEYTLAQKNQLDYGGGLFDPPPTNIIGNISNINSKEDYTLGNFSISNNYKTRIFVPFINNAEENFCQCPESDPGCGQPFFDYCCDCRLYPGAFTTRPTYFPEI